MAKELYHRNPEDYVPDSLKSREKFKNPNNRVYLEGRIVEDLQIEYEFNNVKYYKTMVVVKRINGTFDKIPIVMSDSLAMEKFHYYVLDKYVKVAGEYQSYNKEDEFGKKHVLLYVFVKHIEVFSGKEKIEKGDTGNAIFLRGRVCKEPVVRGENQDIVNIVLEVPRAKGITTHKDYINCVYMTKNSTISRKLKYDDLVEIYGIIQSRRYLKKDEPNGVYKTAYNVLIKRIFRLK